MKRWSAAFTCATSASVGRGMATSGGTGADGPMTGGATGACVVAGGCVAVVCACTVPPRAAAVAAARNRAESFMADILRYDGPAGVTFGEGRCLSFDMDGIETLNVLVARARSGDL